jgi:hypothetical protein
MAAGLGALAMGGEIGHVHDPQAHVAELPDVKKLAGFQSGDQRSDEANY